jgi:hypothetical protein
MEPNRIGRILGVGARVAGEKLRERTAQARAAESNRPATPSSAAIPRPSSPPQPSARTMPAAPAPSLAEGSRRFARGAGRFGAAMWRPFAHATSLLTLQITGVFFALFAFVFGAHSWQLYRSAGWHDHHLPMYAGFGLLFLWFAISSFWRVRRRQKQPATPKISR